METSRSVLFLLTLITRGFPDLKKNIQVANILWQSNKNQQGSRDI